jgi:hypothetical protein
MMTIEALQAWAAGSYADTAAVELLARAFGGRFAWPGRPWIGTDTAGRAWLDGEVLRAARDCRAASGEFSRWLLRWSTRNRSRSSTS